jgi:hypothetical protein
MNRLLEMEKDLKVIKEKRYAKRKLLSKASAISLRKRPKFSHEMAIFTHMGLDTEDAWIKVVLDNSTTVSISRYTRVKDVTTSNGREHFTIVDWPYEGKKASVKAKAKGSWFKSLSYEDTGGIVTYDKGKKELSFGSNKTPIKTYMSDPLPAGSYNLFLPDHPHDGGNNYTNLSKYATAWFKVEQTHDKLNRYLHVGKATAGCVTCGETGTASGTDDDRKRWTEVYNYLINRRASKGTKYVGVLKVV